MSRFPVDLRRCLTPLAREELPPALPSDDLHKLGLGQHVLNASPNRGTEVATHGRVLEVGHQDEIALLKWTLGVHRAPRHQRAGSEQRYQSCHQRGSLRT